MITIAHINNVNNNPMGVVNLTLFIILKVGGIPNISK